MSGSTCGATVSLVQAHSGHLLGHLDHNSRHAFADVNIVCQDGQIKAHRLVLGASSLFLRELLLDLPHELDEVTLMIPNTNKDVVENLVDFLYTGKMVVSRDNTLTLHKLVTALQIDPENVRVEAAKSSSEAAKSSSEAVKSSFDDAKSSFDAAKSSFDDAKSSFDDDNRVVETKAMPLRKRTASVQEATESVKQKEPKIFSPQLTPTPKLQTRGSTHSSRRGQLRRRGRASMTSRSNHSRMESDASVPGYHDMSNVDTWVCAICKKYDPILPPDVDPSLAQNTEWVGCDCNRWYHQFCTGLDTIPKNFKCAMVKLKCLPS